MVIPSLLVVMVEAGVSLPVEVFAHLAAMALSWIGLSRFGFSGRWSLSRFGFSGRWLGVAVVAGAVVAAMAVLDRLDGRTIGLGFGPGFYYDDTLFVLFMASVGGPVAAGFLAWTWPRFRYRGRAGWARLPVTVAAVTTVALVTPVPYGVAFKLVAIAGVVGLPVAAYVMARLGGLAFPGPALMAAGTLAFLFDRSFNIYGGNLLSTMAGEFAYSLGLMTAVFYMGVASRGLHTGGDRVTAGVLLALAGLTHLFTAFFALVFTVAMLTVRRGWDRLRWVLVTGILAGLLSAWWVLPFFWNRKLLNDMGWGKQRTYLSALWSRTSFSYDFLVNDPPLQLFVVLAALGAVICFIRRVHLGMALAVTAAVVAAVFVILPEWRLWNVRLLPFYYLSVYLLAAIGVSEVIRIFVRLISVRLAGTGMAITATMAGMAVAAMMVMVGLPLRSLPGGRLDDGGVYRWGPLHTDEFHLGGSWIEYNFSGYENKSPTEAGGGTLEYAELVETMKRVGTEYGCGRSLWEYESERLGSYGTTMAPMLLPYWTDRCIASMEGLYFEASATTPYHFLMQSELSGAPSRSQRSLPYSRLDVAAGVDHLQAMGVRYYLAFSEPAVAQARAEPDLDEIATSGPWVIFEVADSGSVVGLDLLPVVIDDFADADYDWLEVSVGAFLASENTPVFAAEGPGGNGYFGAEDWPTLNLVDLDDEGRLAAARASASGRVAVMRAFADLLGEGAPRRRVEPAAVSDIVWGDQSISFTVDRLGSPVLVRASYFPNWSVTGGDGPYRVTPNLMVVIPTATEVTLEYGRSQVELVALGLTLVGLAGSVYLAVGVPGRTVRRSR